MGGNGRREKRGKKGDIDRVERKGENGQKKERGGRKEKDRGKERERDIERERHRDT